MIDAEELNRIANIRTVLAHYGIEPNRAGFICCVAHNDSRPSMKVYERTNSVHCFACGADFNSINLIMHMEKCGFHRAVEIIKNWFSCDTVQQSSEYEEKLRKFKEKQKKAHCQYVANCEKLHSLQDKLSTLSFGDEAMEIAYEIYALEESIDDYIKNYKRGDYDSVND